MKRADEDRHAAHDRPGSRASARALPLGSRGAAERLHAPRGADRRRPRAAARLRARRPSGAARLVFAIDPDEDEDQERGDAADDERDRAAVADSRAADPDQQAEEERPQERRDPVVDCGGPEMHRCAILPARPDTNRTWFPASAGTM